MGRQQSARSRVTLTGTSAHALAQVVPTRRRDRAATRTHRVPLSPMVRGGRREVRGVSVQAGKSPAARRSAGQPAPGYPAPPPPLSPPPPPPPGSPPVAPAAQRPGRRQGRGACGCEHACVAPCAALRVRAQRVRAGWPAAAGPRERVHASAYQGWCVCTAVRASLSGGGGWWGVCVCVRRGSTSLYSCACVLTVVGASALSSARQDWPLCLRIDASGKSADSKAQPQRRPCVRTAKDSKSLARPSPFAPPSPPPPFWRDTTQRHNGDRKKGWGRAADCNAGEQMRVESGGEGQAERGSGENRR